ncbi:unnamed protein product [Parnassius mnemosyne]|uniref:Cytosolic fatty-acid binding proteins domain-containing protein n=1 Tax=Parnassius mnemosyne TaxID=213953 RepID=A0AAV1L4K6_9NEOP
MAFYGKVFAVEKDENYEAFVKSMGIPEDKQKNLLEYKPTQKIAKNGDEYTVTVGTKNGERVYNFKSGIEFASTIRDQPAKITVTVDGNKMTQVVKFDIGLTLTLKKEYTDDTLTEEISHNGWDGVARRFYKAQ